jgi:outer membrane cobalamin receptor
VKHFYALLIVLMCNMLCLVALRAQKSVPDSTMRNRELAQVVVTGTGTHNRAQNAVVPVQVLTAEELQRMNVASLEDALKQLTSSVTTMTNGMGTTMMMNGLSEDYILILENGKRLTGDDRYTRINMANVKRIEVLSGASSALYGSEAIGGVINIITTTPSMTAPSSAGNNAQCLMFNVQCSMSIHLQRRYEGWSLVRHRWKELSGSHLPRCGSPLCLGG